MSDIKAITPRAWQTLPESQRKVIEDYAKCIAKEQLEKDGRLMLDLYIKMVCLTLHEVFGFGEERLYLFLGNHKRLFLDQQKRVQDNTQVEYLNEQMAKIFKKSGFPESFFDQMLGPIDTQDN